MKYTNQTAFTKSYKHLLEQGQVSELPATLKGSQGVTCAYRGENGRMCAIGCLIPDELYKKSFEGKTITSGFIKLEDMGLDGVSKDLLADLQMVHDLSSPHEWNRRLDKLAVKYELEIPE